MENRQCSDCGKTHPFFECNNINHEPEFIEFIKSQRNAISREMLIDEWWLKIPTSKRVVIENVLIAYDQMVIKINELPAPDESTDYQQLKEWAEKMEGALQSIITFNRQQALDQYGDAEKAEGWACVKVAREALAGMGKG